LIATCRCNPQISWFWMQMTHGSMREFETTGLESIRQKLFSTSDIAARQDTMRRFPWGLVYERTAVADMFLDHGDGSASRISPIGVKALFYGAACNRAHHSFHSTSDTKSLLGLRPRLSLYQAWIRTRRGTAMLANIARRFPIFDSSSVYNSGPMLVRQRSRIGRLASGQRRSLGGYCFLAPT